MTTFAPPGLRERKAAKLKLLLTDLLTEEMKTRSFDDINVEVLCEKAMISKVTFYNYFPEKDDLMRFFLSVWVYRSIIECHRLKKDGMAAIRWQFENMADELNENPNLYGNMISLLTKKGNMRYVQELTLAERAALYPDSKLYAMKVELSMGAFIREQCRIATERSEINSSLSAEDISMLVGSVLHGACIIGFRVNPDKPGTTCLKMLKVLIHLLKK